MMTKRKRGPLTSLALLCLIFLNAHALSVSAQVSSSSKAKVTPKTELKDWRWQYRLLILNVSSDTIPESLKNTLLTEKAELTERRLKIVLTHQNTHYEFDYQSSDGEQLKPIKLSTSEINTRLQNKPSILIGLDGQTKSFYDWPRESYRIDLSEVYKDIDGMPMRRAELY